MGCFLLSLWFFFAGVVARWTIGVLLVCDAGNVDDADQRLGASTGQCVGVHRFPQLGMYVLDAFAQ